MTQFNPNISEIANRKKIALVQACWHRDIVDEFRDAFIVTLAKSDDRQVDVFEVPGFAVSCVFFVLLTPVFQSVVQLMLSLLSSHAFA